MDRRDALKRVGLVMGGAISAPLMSGMLAGCQAPAPSSGYVLKRLTADQNELVATISELIIPTTDTPGARAAGVNEFVDLMLDEWYPEEDVARFIAGLTDANQRAQDAHNSDFVDLTEEQQTSLLEELESEAMAARSAGDDPAFFSMIKELTLTGYYTSEIGATQELKYVHEAGYYNGDVPYSEVGKAYS